MNRIIKFKAWNKKKNKMVENCHKVNNWDHDCSCHCGLSSYYGFAFHKYLEHTDIYEVMQFTGLKDKNGVEIYFGDLVIFKGQDEPMEVEFRGQRIFPYINETTEVVGNIYENPELVEEQNT